MAMDPNKRFAVKLALVPFVMFGFGYAMVPLYDVICDVTGLGGRTGEISAEQAERGAVDTERVVTVEFDTNINGELPWRFGPLQRKVTVHPGEIGEALFYAENTANHAVVGQAIPSMAPAKASVYFNKTECFCFRQQTLAAGERVEMPVRFVVDPDLPEDIHSVVLSYTFFAAPQPVAGKAEDNETNSI